jgi:SDR family mycofactocin-dependent oxidoreductase
VGKLDGRVAFITGAARGQGRSHALRLAGEGAHVVISDICAPVAENRIPPSTPEDLAETVRLLDEAGHGTKVLSRQVDVRDADALIQLANDAMEQFGRIDIVVANAGILNYEEFTNYTTDMFTAVIDVNLTGVFNTCRATVPHLIAGGRGGSIILISSTAGLKGQPFTPGYTAAKHGVLGLAKGLANELGEYNIRVNTIHPAGVQTPMGEAHGLMEIINKHAMTMGPLFMNTLPALFMQPDEISTAVLFLASDDSKMITAMQMKVDMGMTNR